MLSVVVWSLIVSLAINGLMFLVAFWRQSDKLTDISYAASFVALAFFIYTTSDKSLYAAIGFFMVVLWAVRIGGFLLYRVMKTGKDARFDGIRENFWKFARFWLGQALTVWILMLPLALAFSRSAVLQWSTTIGVIIWITGLVLESVADLQKYHFSQDIANKNKWIDEGVWQYSRHPNYFGEMLVWVGMYVFALSALTPIGMIVALASPVFIVCLLLFVSGIPILEKSADKRWGSQLAYKRYKQQTSILVPLPKRKV